MQRLKNAVLALLIVAIFAVRFAGTTLGPSPATAKHVDASVFYRALDDGEVYAVHIDGNEVSFRRAGSTASFRTTASIDSDMARRIANTAIKITDPLDGSQVHNAIQVTYQGEVERPFLETAVREWLPPVLFVGLLYVVLGRILNMFWAPLITKPGQLSGFGACGGHDAAKTELRDLLAVLREPDALERLGGRAARSVLITGPSGAGKTTLARCAAGEAGVPLLETLGADLVPAGRVRVLFEKARNEAPAIVLVDRIESLSNSMGGLDELATALDQLEGKPPVVLIATTASPDRVDACLVRPGRLDRTVALAPPDHKGREAMLKACAAKIPLAGDIDWPALAQRTEGWLAARLRQLVDEAAVVAGRNQRSQVSRQDFADALQKLGA